MGIGSTSEAKEARLRGACLPWLLRTHCLLATHMSHLCITTCTHVSSLSALGYYGKLPSINVQLQLQESGDVMGATW